MSLNAQCEWCELQVPIVFHIQSVSSYAYGHLDCQLCVKCAVQYHKDEIFNVKAQAAIMSDHN